LEDVHSHLGSTYTVKRDGILVEWDDIFKVIILSNRTVWQTHRDTGQPTAPSMLCGDG
jgi:hypothetical protein